MKKTTLAILAAMAVASAARADTALYFNGSTYINLNKKFPLGDSVSLSAWVRIDPSITANPPAGSGFTGAGIVGQGYWGGTTGFGMLVSSGLTTAATSDDRIGIQVRNGDTNLGLSYLNPTLFTAGEWHHYLLVRDKAAGKVYFYADGVLVSSGNFSSSLSIYATKTKATTNFAFGKNTTGVGGYFKGYIADVGLWNVALTAEDAARLTQVRPNMIGKAPYAFFPLDEGTGTKVKDTISGTQYPKTDGTLNWVEDPTLHRLGVGTLKITGHPAEYGSPSPPYGATNNLAEGASFQVSAPEAWTNATADLRAVCAGWKLYDINDNLTNSGNVASFTYVHPTPAALRRLEWQWDKHYRVKDATGDGQWARYDIAAADNDAPVLTNVVFSGAGGDTLVISGSVANVLGSDCSLTALTADDADSPEMLVWREAGVVLDGNGDFSITLHTNNTASARYLAPGSTVYAALCAVSDGHAKWIAPQAVTMRRAPVFTATSAEAHQRTVTFSGRFSTPGMGTTEVSLWVGSGTDAATFTQSGEAIVVADGASFSFTHAFPAFNEAYGWQFRAVSTAAGGTDSVEARTAVATVTPLDKATYTWRQDVPSGNWNDAGNWDDGVGGDSIGYPCTANSTAYFAPGTVAAIHFPESVTFGTLLVTNRNIDVSFTAATGTAITNSYIHLGLIGSAYPNRGIDFAGKGRIVIDGFDWYVTSSNCRLYAGRELHLLNGAKLSVPLFTVYAKTYTYWPETRIEVRDGSALTSRGSMIISGNTTLLISNATVRCTGFYCDYCNYYDLKDGGGRIRFEGRHPLFVSTGTYCTTYGTDSFSSRAGDFDFLIPEGGYEEPPFQYTGTGIFMKPVNSTTKLQRFNILADSPAVLSGEALEQTLVSLTTAMTSASLVGLRPSETVSQTMEKAADNKSIIFRQVPSDGILTVTATPAKLGGPDYTAHTNLADGATLTLTCSATATDYPYVTCGGYRLYDVAADGTRTEVAGSPFAGTTCNYVHGGGRRELEWIWNVPELYVATTGDDSNSGADWDNALKSPQKALDRYRYAKVFLAAGTYSSSKTFNVTNAITLVGCGATPSDTKLVHVTSDLRVLNIGNSGAVVTNLLVTNDKAYLQGGVSMSGGLLVGCVVTNCYTKLNTYHGGGIYLTGGTVRNCSICYNMAYDSGGAYKYGGGIYMTGGLVETCHIIGNTHSTDAGGSPGKGGGIYMTAGTVRNCLVARNWARNTGYGIYAEGGRVENCTLVANNYTKSDSTGRAFVVSEGAAAINNIIVDNSNLNGEANRSFNYNSLLQNNCTSPLIAWGDGNVNVDPAFTDFAHRDYTLGGFSACVNGGRALSWHNGAKDLNGNPRVIGPAVDIGCYERAASSGLECSFTAVSDGGVDNAAITLSALADGNLEGVTYIWTITDQDGNSVTNFSSGSSASTSVTLGPRLYTVSLTVTNSAGATAEASLENVVRVKASLAYLNAAGSDTRPYATLAEGAHDVASALEMLADGGTLLVADGIYTIRDRVNLNSGNGLTIRSLNGPDNAVIRAVSSTQFSSANLPMFQLSSSKARLEGLTIVGGKPGPYNATEFRTYNAVVVSASGAVVTNCVIRDVIGVHNGPEGTGMSLSSGTVVDVQFLNCLISMSSGVSRNSAALRMTGGTAERLVISNCCTTGTSSWTSQGAAVYMSGGSMRNSLVTKCDGSWGPVVYVGGSAKMDNCTIAGNTTSYTETSTSGGNTLYHVAGIIVSSSSEATAKIRNCIVAENIDKKCGESNLYWRASWAAKVSNTLVAVPNATTGKDAYGNIATPSAIFRNSAARDYTLKGSSPARDAGAWLTDWMTDASLDLTHRPRVFGHSVDMGCYECTSPFATMLLLQ